MKVFKREEIPDSYHIKNADYALDLLIIPRFNNVSLGADSDHPNLYLPPALGNDTDEYQRQGKGAFMYYVRVFWGFLTTYPPLPFS